MKYFPWLLLGSLTLASCSAKFYLMPNPTAAWIPIGESQNSEIISIDTGTLSHQENQVKAWVRIDYKKAQSLKQNATQLYAAFHCKDYTFQTSREVQLGTMGETIQDQLITMKPKQVTPLSPEGIAFQYICLGKKVGNF